MERLRRCKGMTLKTRFVKALVSCMLGAAVLPLSAATVHAGAPARAVKTSAAVDTTDFDSAVVQAGCHDTGVNCDLNGCESDCCDSSGCGSGGLMSGLFGGCNSGCDTACDAMGCDTGLLGYGIVKRSDHCFDDFISPMTNPVFFEDPRNLTEARFIFLHHNLPDSLLGNSVNVYAMQFRLALTERLSLIATKDGFVDSQSPILDSGYADLAAGLKYNLYRDACAGTLLSGGFTYEIPMGSNRSLQGNGSGEWNFFVTGGKRLGSKSHWISAAGIRVPNDDNAENQVSYWSNHWDRQIGDRPIYAFTEVNWYHYMSSGTAFGPVEGGDLFNLGSSGVTGNDLVTQAIGGKFKPRRHVEIGVAYEFPLTERKGLLEDRLTADLIFRY
jgi:hypothetical protein